MKKLSNRFPALARARSGVAWAGSEDLLLLFPLAVREQFTKRCAESKHKSGFFMTLRFEEGVYCGVLMKDILHAIPLYHSDKTFRDSLRPGWISGVSKVSSTPTLAFSMDSIRRGVFRSALGVLMIEFYS